MSFISRLIAAALGLAFAFAFVNSCWAQTGQALYWQCVAPSSSNPQGGYCPVGNTYQLPVYNQVLNATAVTPSDTTVIPATRALYNGNGSACNIAVEFTTAGPAVTYQNVQIGQNLPISVVRVMNTNTTCSNILAQY